jgi:hypothetical protein
VTFDNNIEKRKTDVRELQDKAFLMFEQAKTLVDQNKKDKAISVYLELIEILNTLRWSNVTKKIQEAIRELQKSSEEELGPVVKETKEEKIFEKPKELSVLRGHALSLQEFEYYKKQEENIQKDAFALLDTGAKKAKEKDFESAIEDYNQAIILLNSIGWQSYTPQIQDAIEKIIVSQKQYTESLRKRMETPETQKIDDLRAKREKLLQEIDSQKINVIEFDERKRVQRNYLFQAAQLVKECEISIQNLDYLEIYKLLQEAAQKIINVGWQEGVTRLTDFISEIKENQFQHELMEQQEHLAYIEKTRISTDIRKHFKEKIVEKENEKATPFRPVESSKEKPKTKSYEQQVFEVITEASQIQDMNDESSKRKIELYNVAYHLIEKSQWTEEKSKVQSIINILKTNLKNRKQRIQTLEENKIHTLDTLHQIYGRIELYMKEFDTEKEIQKANLLKFQEEQESIASLEKTAFKYIDYAKKFTKNKEYEEAIHAYQVAIEKFTTLRWNEQIPYLVTELENIKKLQSQFQAEQQLKTQLKEHEVQKKQAQIKAEEAQKEKELQNLQDISRMISGVVRQKEMDEKLKEKSEQEYRKNIEKPEQTKQIQEFKEMIRKASRKKSDE